MKCNESVLNITSMGGLGYVRGVAERRVKRVVFEMVDGGMGGDNFLALDEAP